MNYTEPFLRKVETAQEELQQQHHSGVSYRAAVAAKNKDTVKNNISQSDLWDIIN